MQLLFAQQMRGPALSDLSDVQRTDFSVALSSIQMGICPMPGVDVFSVFPSHVLEGA